MTSTKPKAGTGLEITDDNAEIEPGVMTPIPRVFQDLIEGLGMPESDDRTGPDEEH